MHKIKAICIKTIEISNVIEEGIIISLIKINEEALACEARAAERLVDFYLVMIYLRNEPRNENIFNTSDFYLMAD